MSTAWLTHCSPDQPIPPWLLPPATSILEASLDWVEQEAEVVSQAAARRTLHRAAKVTETQEPNA